MKRLLCLAFLMFIVMSAQAEWIMLETELRPGEAHYFDSESAEEKGDFRKIWVLSSYDQEQVGGYHSVKTFYEFDCKKGRARAYTMLLYSDIKASGDVIGAHHDKTKDWFYYPPDSTFNRISDTVCAI
ncbi:hypothetical protein SAMN05216419_102827 [Nitrosomonas cryotolerans]|uniref:Surface-adhesin protein E-like domain-containing protein n=1 Tax=Nitrosomonas cryotolerans ATCC 49181 TaxID=1131553 RepID=A0A1N6GDB5_9PROT|nr:surface-adhesin E family protein [Nitrosomonas cryotolerans]SFP88526.1 hypothetical protein SAMN05216419_102827 [Nitrosomonas cryotolerans]SIO05523.1 hypothetical protein SAMN02743940_0658 [Nitrosomonas cryotolerans ATCC 49181]